VRVAMGRRPHELIWLTGEAGRKEPASWGGNPGRRTRLAWRSGCRGRTRLPWRAWGGGLRVETFHWRAGRGGGFGAARRILGTDCALAMAGGGIRVEKSRRAEQCLCTPTLTTYRVVVYYSIPLSKCFKTYKLIKNKSHP
jgi:hypothetical protein